MLIKRVKLWKFILSFKKCRKYWIIDKQHIEMHAVLKLQMLSFKILIN